MRKASVRQAPEASSSEERRMESSQCMWTLECQSKELPKLGWSSPQGLVIAARVTVSQAIGLCLRLHAIKLNSLLVRRNGGAYLKGRCVSVPQNGAQISYLWLPEFVGKELSLGLALDKTGRRNRTQA